MGLSLFCGAPCPPKHALAPTGSLPPLAYVTRVDTYGSEKPETCSPPGAVLTSEHTCTYIFWTCEPPQGGGSGDREGCGGGGGQDGMVAAAAEG